MYLLDEKGEYLIQTTGAVDAYNQPVRLPYRRISLDSERSLVAQAGRTRQGVIVNDITNSDEFSLTPMLPEARSEMAVPMVVVDRLIGVLDVQTREVNHFTEADIWVMATLADLIAVAIENARLYKRGQELAALEERTRLARELHDSVSQALYGIALGARTARTLLERDPSRLAEPLDYVMSLAEAGLTEMRALIFDLRPESLQNEGLTTALAKQAASLQARHGIQVETHLCAEPMLPLEVKETLYRIAREALHNTVKHAQATHILLCMRCEDDAIALEVKDNGHGFDPAGDFPGHLGLHSMRERTARLNGSFEITSAPGEGTRVFVRIGLPLALA
jgi:signal transduction histidine kinase